LKTGARVRVRARASPEVVTVAVMEEEAWPRVLARASKGRARWLGSVVARAIRR
jgi:hypothetical protein